MTELWLDMMIATLTALAGGLAEPVYDGHGSEQDGVARKRRLVCSLLHVARGCLPKRSATCMPDSSTTPKRRAFALTARGARPRKGGTHMFPLHFQGDAALSRA